MDKLISTYFSDDNPLNRCDVVLDTKDERYRIDYYLGESLAYTEKFPNNSLSYVEDAAENWACGIKVVDFDRGT